MIFLKKITLWIFTFMLVGTMLLLILGFINFLHPFFDSLSHFRIHLLLIFIALLFISIFLYSGRLQYLTLGILLVSLLYLYLLNRPFSPPEKKIAGHTLTHMQFNLNFKNQHLDKLQRYLNGHTIDLVTLQEVTPSHREFLETLTNYPYQRYCPFQAVGGVAILSRYPILENKSLCTDHLGLLKTEVSVGDKTLTVVSVHLYWPFPMAQPKQVQRLLPLLHELSGPTLIAGDFNAVSWSDTLKQIASASHTTIIPGMRWSIALKTQLPFMPYIELPIDHVLVSSGLEVQRIFVAKGLGSDHFPIVSTLGY